MYYLWSEKNCPPWEWTGDPERYPEDVNAFFQLSEIDHAAENRRKAKAEAEQRMKERAARMRGR
jgi:hypothetical protein